MSPTSLAMPTQGHQTQAEASSVVFIARLEPAGNAFDAPADLPLLVAAELSGIAGSMLASSCRNGTCRTCICQLMEGHITYRIAWPGLSAEEKAEGYMLSCVAYPLTDVVIRLAP